MTVIDQIRTVRIEAELRFRTSFERLFHAVAVGPMTEQEASPMQTYGDIPRFAEPLRQLVEGS